MNNYEIFHFAGKCLALDDNSKFRQEILEKSEENQINWQHFVTVCSNHLILPAIYLKFRSHNILKFIPPELSEHLEEIYRLNVTRNQQITAQIHKITDTLNKKNIYPIFLKGAGNLLDKLYSDIGERILGDIDFLVSEKDYLVSAQLLLDEGYLYANEKDTRPYTNIKTAKHYPRLYHPDLVAPIEIHRIPTKEKFTAWFNSEIIDKDKKEVSSLSGCYVPSFQNRIIHNFIHSQLSNEGYLFGRVSLRDAYDIYLFSKRFPLEKTIPNIKTHKKATAYFAYSDSILGMQNSLFSNKNVAFQILSFKHKLNQNSALFFHVNRSIIFISQRIFGVYFSLILKAIYSKEKRKYLSSRIRSPKWYGDHLSLYIKFFRRS